MRKTQLRNSTAQEHEPSPLAAATAITDQPKPTTYSPEDAERQQDTTYIQQPFRDGWYVAKIVLRSFSLSIAVIAIALQIVRTIRNNAFGFGSFVIFCVVSAMSSILCSRDLPAPSFVCV